MYPIIPNELTNLFCNHPNFPIIIPPITISQSLHRKFHIIYIHIYIYIRLYIIIIPLLVAWHIIFIHVSCLILEVIFCHHAPNIPPTQCAINIIIKGKKHVRVRTIIPPISSYQLISVIFHMQKGIVSDNS